MFRKITHWYGTLLSWLLAASVAILIFPVSLQIFSRYAKEIGAPFELVKWVHDHGRLPVVNFAAGGIATPADAALMMHLGMDGVFVGSGIFKSGDPRKRARAIVRAVAHYNDPEVLAEVSEDLGEPMVGINLDQLKEEERLAKRGW